MLISDVKGELYLYTAENLKRLGYDVIAIDYINFLKSNKYNYLDIIINAVEDDNIPLAESLVSDMVNILLPVIANLPDISKTHFNKINGMGSKEHNQKLRIDRENARIERPIKPIKIWNIWNKKTEEEIPKKKVEVIQDNFRKNIKGQ